LFITGYNIGGREERLMSDYRETTSYEGAYEALENCKKVEEA